MNVLVLGAYGLIGTEIVRHLAAKGYTVTGFGRRATLAQTFFPHIRWRTADMATLTLQAAWRPFLDGIDAVVNASGALQSSPRDDLAKTQRDSIEALIAACAQAGVSKYIQISAPGADQDASTEFLRTKGDADAALRESPLDWVILKPALVIAPTAHGGTSLVRALAAFPIIQPLVAADAVLTIVDVADVAAATERALSDQNLSRQTFDLGTAEALTLQDVVKAFRRWLGFKDAKAVMHAPNIMADAIAKLADIAGLFGWRAPMRSTALKVLRDGVRADPEPWRHATGETLKTLTEALARIPATRQERSFARLELIFPLLVIAFAAFWIASGVIGLARLEAAAAVVSGALGPAMAYTAVISGALLDIAIGTAMLFRRVFQPACIAAAITATAYVILGSILTPELWTDPLGPLVKIVPVVGLALALASYAEER